MTLTVTKKTITHIENFLKGPLPGWTGQQPMAPEYRQNIDHKRLIQRDHREGSVLVLLYSGADKTLHFVLTRRPTYSGVHSGQISLPGGKREPNEGLSETALRETFEEIGVARKSLRLLGQLSSLYIPPSNFMVYPFVAFAERHPAFHPDPVEVAELIETPLSLILDHSEPYYQMMAHTRLGQIPIPYYDVYGHVVWGATAMILSEFITLINQ